MNISVSVTPEDRSESFGEVSFQTKWIVHVSTSTTDLVQYEAQIFAGLREDKNARSVVKGTHRRGLTSPRHGHPENCPDSEAMVNKVGSGSFSLTDFLATMQRRA